MDLPTGVDWRSEPWGMDTPYAYMHFHGKTISESTPLFEKNALYYQEDLMYMPSRVFGYYVKAYIAYLMSDTAKGDSAGASAFIDLINYKYEYNYGDVVALWPEIEPVLKKLAEQQDYFDAAWVDYGSFRARVHEIIQRGLDASFDTAIPEIVPQSVTLRAMTHTDRTILWSVAVQVFRNSGIDQFDVASIKQDILRVFGPPSAIGGGDHPKYGYIPDWIRYEHSHCGFRFEFDGNSIVSVTFGPVTRCLRFAVPVTQAPRKV